MTWTVADGAGVVFSTGDAAGGASGRRINSSVSPAGLRATK
jgi:hypothetical protein